MESCSAENDQRRSLMMGLLFGLSLVLCYPVTADAFHSRLDDPRIAIIIDDMGNTLAGGRAAIELPGRLTYAFLPHTPYASALAKQAHAREREIMLHLPMESDFNKRPGPGALTLHMTHREFVQTFKAALNAVPHVVGVNNHMGSLLTRHPGAMGWLMTELMVSGNLYFIDSRTTVETVAQQLAQEYGVGNGRRDVFLDNVRNREAIRAQLRLLVRKAKRLGKAIGIGHPHIETLAVLSEELPQLQVQGIRLVPVSEIAEEHDKRRESWRASSSPLPKAARNLKQ